MFSKKTVLKIKRFFYSLVKPISIDEDIARSEFILNVLLLGTIFLSLVATICSFVTSMELKREGVMNSGLPLSLLIVMVCFFLVLYVFSRRGMVKLATYIFVGFYFLLASLLSFHWGVYTPQAFLMFSLVIIMGGILVDSAFAFLILLVGASMIFLFTYLQFNNLINYDSSWKDKSLHFTDIVVYVATLCVIFIVSWLSNKEIEKSLARARSSEKALKLERDMLEIRVAQRTDELKKEQLEKIEQLSKFVNFGKLSSGIFHDLVNHLSVLFLNLEKASELHEGDLADVKRHFGQALKAKVGVENYLNVVRNQLREQETLCQFSFAEEIKKIIKTLTFKANKNDVRMVFSANDDTIFFGSIVKFNHVITNIIANAIDAYDNKNKEKNKKRKIDVDITKENGNMKIVIKDYGSGIAKENMNKIFEPFFSTKAPDKGTGIGLAIAKEITANDFGGTIGLESELGLGTTFIIKIPVKQT